MFYFLLYLITNSKVETYRVKIVLPQYLSIYENVVQVVYCINNNFIGRFHFRLGELHVSMTHLRGIGPYIEGSGLDSIWIQSDIYGPAVTISICPAPITKDVSTRTVAALYRLFFKVFFIENPEIEQTFLQIIALKEITKEKHERRLKFLNDIWSKLCIFNEKLLKTNLCKFIVNYIEMYQRSQEFVFASRSQNGKLH